MSGRPHAPEQPRHEAMAPLALDERARQARRGVTRWLGAAAPQPAAELRSLAEYLERLDPGDGAREWDRYGSHGPVEELERRVAELLGKPAAAMFPSGVMAQQSMLRVWCDERQSTRVAIPELSHLLQHELDGPRLLHDLRFELLTRGAAVPTARHLAAIPGRLGALLLELPLRDAGFLLPTWEELEELTAAARQRGVAVHFDGARVWESQPWFGRSLAGISDLADSVYVSLYKGLGGLAGAVVAGPEAEVEQARQWRTRHGGTLFSLLPYAVAGLRGLDEQLPRMGEYHQRAVELARALAQRGFVTVPEEPRGTAFRLLAPGTAADLYERAVSHMEDRHESLTPRWADSDVQGWAWTEVTVGPHTMEWGLGEAVDALAGVFLRAR